MISPTEVFYQVIAMVGRSIVGVMFGLVGATLGYVTYFALVFLLAEDLPWIQDPWHFLLWIGGGAALGGSLAWVSLQTRLQFILLAFLAAAAAGYGGAWWGYEYGKGLEYTGAYAARFTTLIISATIFGAAMGATGFTFTLGLIRGLRSQGA